MFFVCNVIYILDEDPMELVSLSKTRLATQVRSLNAAIKSYTVLLQTLPKLKCDTAPGSYYIIIYILLILSHRKM